MKRILVVLACLFLAGLVHAGTIVAAAGSAGVATDWTAGGTWVGGVAPGAGDDAQITVATVGNITVNTGAVCRSADFTGFGASLIHTAGVNWQIGDGTAGLTSIALKMVAGMTYTLGNATTCLITFRSTAVGSQNITTGGKTAPSVTINGAGSSYALQDNLTMSGSWTYTAGTTWDTTTGGNKTMTLIGSNISFSGGAKTYYELDLTGAGAATVSGANTFTNFNRTGTAVKTDSIQITANQTVTGVATLAGNSVTNRMFVVSSALGTARTLTVTGATKTFSNVDFRDITFANGGVNLDLSAITGNSGDCLGNSISGGGTLTFTTPATQTSTGTSSFTWSTHGWTSRVPLPQDDVVISNAFSSAQTVTQDMPRAGKSIDWSGASWTGTAVSWAKTTACDIYGGITFKSGMSQTGTSLLTFVGRSSFSITSAGCTLTNPITISMIGGTFALADAISISGTINTLTLSNGTLDAANSGANANVTLAGPMQAQFSSATRAILMGTGTWTLTGTGTVWNTSNATGFTLTPSTSTLVISETTQGTSKTVALATSQTLGNITFSGKNILVTCTTGATFGAIALNNLGDTTGVSLQASRTYTCTGFTSTASAGNVAKLISGTPASQATLSKSSGTVSVDYCTITDSAATGGAAWYAGSNSTLSNTSGWINTGPPSASTSNFFSFFQ